MKEHLKRYLDMVFVIAAASVCFSEPIQAQTVVVNPSDDGAIYTCNGCNNSVVTYHYLLTSGEIQGVTIFQTPILQLPIAQALLSVNPYGLPLYGQQVSIYGFASITGFITSGDANAGTFLGVLNLPANLGYGQDAFFDVTSFLQVIASPYVGFNLRTPISGTDVFSSLEYNYGHPSQLTVTPIPEPETYAMLLAGLGILGFVVRRRKPQAA